MTVRRARDGWRTRARISEVATTLFLEQGFANVTVAEVARAAGVSKVTVFAHFPRKEDLVLDRGPEAVELIGSALRERLAGTSALDALRALAVDLLDHGHPLSGLSEDSVPFLRTVAESRELLTRALEIAADLETKLAQLLADDKEAVADPQLLATLIIGAYRTQLVKSVRYMLDNGLSGKLTADHRHRIDASFDALDAAAQALAAHPITAHRKSKS
jgi:AcrR family transcriptional regulator